MASPSASPAAPAGVYRGLINDPATQVVEAMEGFLLTSENSTAKQEGGRSHPHCNKLDGGNAVKVIVRADWNAASTPHVAIISGGGDGHAPAHSGFVGAGMLTAAVSGDVFASPSVKAVLAAIRAVARSNAPLLGAAASQEEGAAPVVAPSPGVLLVVKNYSGDRLNFGLAMSQAILEHIPVAMCIVGDDVALPRSKGVTGRRGIAGTVLVHKIAGYAASQGKPLAEVSRLAELTARSIVSLGVATSTCNVPGNAPDATRLPPGQMEIGIGIHGEAGMQQLPLEPAKQVVARMVAQLLSTDPECDYFHRYGSEEMIRPLQPNTHIVLLVNNLGGATATEMNIFTSEAITLLQRDHGLVVRRVLTGTLMSALDMRGISLTLLRLDPHEAEWQLEALDAETAASGWPKTIARDPFLPIAIPMPAAPASASEAEDASASAAGGSASVVSESLLATLASTVLQNSSRLNELDAKAGDGDCGTTLSNGARSLQALLSEGKLQRVTSLSGLLRTLATHVGESMGGSSGAIVQILLTGAAAAAQQQERADAAAGGAVSPSNLALRFAHALSCGIASVSQFGGAVEGDRTMLDALVPAVRACQAALASQASVTAAMQQAAAAAREGANRTRGMRSRAGRSNYVSGEALSDADPGAEAVALLWEAAALTLG